MEPLRLGIIGCGVIGRVHMKAAIASPGIDLVAIADLREDAAREAAEEFAVRTVYAEGVELLDDPNVEAVVLAMPACVRTPLALRAFERGKHVLTEKPVAMNAGEVEQMIAARGDLVAACCSSRYRFPASATATAAFIASGEMGELRVVRCKAVMQARPRPEKLPPSWRLQKAQNGGGILVNWGCYDLDYLLGITGWSLKPRLVLAQTWRIPPQLESYVVPNSDAETHFAAIIRCEGGTAILFERGEYMPARAESAWQIAGTRGTLQLKMAHDAQKQIVYDYTTPEDGVVSKTIWEGEEDHGALRAGLMEDFAAAIRGEGEAKTPLERALVIQKITDAIYASAEQGKAVEID